MYGKIYEQTFTGSMYGKGPLTFAVWSYIIAHTKHDHTVELNPRIVAAAIGCPEKDVVAALEMFCSPDKKSRNKEHRGRKLIRKGEYLYLVTGHEHFRNFKTDEERKAYMRNYMRKRRKQGEV